MTPEEQEKLAVDLKNAIDAFNKRGKFYVSANQKEKAHQFGIRYDRKFSNLANLTNPEALLLSIMDKSSPKNVQLMLSQNPKLKEKLKQLPISDPLKEMAGIIDRTAPASVKEDEIVTVKDEQSQSAPPSIEPALTLPHGWTPLNKGKPYLVPPGTAIKLCDSGDIIVIEKLERNTLTFTHIDPLYNRETHTHTFKGQPFRVGRGSDNEFITSSPMVSRKHGAFILNAQGGLEFTASLESSHQSFIGPAALAFQSIPSGIIGSSECRAHVPAPKFLTPSGHNISV